MNLTKLDINLLINKVDNFPTLPTIYSVLMEIMENPRSTSNDVAFIITQDQSSASKILKTANSPLYGFYGKIENISQAISYIGFDEVKNLITALTIIDFFNKNFELKHFNPVEFWKHSIAAGIMTRLIGKASGAKDLENYFLAGILHDIGKMLFFTTIPEIYSKVQQHSTENKLTSLESEMLLLGISHCIAGEILADKWNLPLSIKNAIRHHCSGVIDSKYKTIVASTHIANIAVSMYGFGSSDMNILPTPNKDAWNILDLPDNFFSLNRKLIYDTYFASINLLLR